MTYECCPNLARRDFLRLGVLAGIPLFTPKILVWAAEPLLADEPRVSRTAWDRVLVLVELQGGNDGLNTVIPYEDDEYYRVRPRLAVPKDEVLGLQDGLALHPSLAPLADLWQKEELATVLGLGYSDPNRSHFRSIAIWETGSDSAEVRQDGWLAELFGEHSPPDGLAAEGIILGREDAGPLQGARNIAMQDARSFLAQAKRLPDVEAEEKNPALAHLLGVRSDLKRAARILEERLAQAPKPAGSFPRTPIGRQCELAAGLLTAKVPVAVLKLTHGGFDTHTNQQGRHQNLLGQLAAALAALRKSLAAAGRWDDVLVMTYSEFGRRVAENGSRGTDHGTAAPHFVLGGQVRGGLYGRQPSLTELDRGDLRFTTDYRSLYATVARDWWRLPGSRRLDRFEPIACIRAPEPAKTIRRERF